MNNRNQNITLLRGESLGITTKESSVEEQFQNQTLRPILKFQNELFLAIFKNYILEHKAKFQTYSIEKKLQFIDTSLQKDHKLRNVFKGVVLGLFTLEEYVRYNQNSSALNKRIMNMLTERLKSQLQLFEL